MKIEALIAGYTAGSLGIFVGHPLDSLKVLAQTSSSKSSFCSISFIRSILFSSFRNKKQLKNHSQEFINNIPNLVIGRNRFRRKLNSVSASNCGKIQSRSFLSLYAGISGPLLTSGVLTSVNFFLYDTLRRTFYRSSQNSTESNKKEYLYHDSLQNVFIAAALSASILSIITSPIIAIKTKQQVMQWSMKEAALDTLKSKGGIRNFYAGYAPHLLCEAFGRATYFTTYEFLKRNMMNFNSSKESEISVLQRILCASLTGMITWTCVFPLDVLRNKMYTQSVRCGNSNPTVSAIQLAYRMWHFEGRWKPFFRGYFVTIARAGPVAAVSLPCYDLTLEWLMEHPRFII